MDKEREKLERRTRQAIPNSLARLIYLASLRDYNTDTYEHAGWSFALTEEEADRALRAFHLKEFSAVLSLSVHDLAIQVQNYFLSLEDTPDECISVWNSLESYRALIPRQSHPVDRRLFLANIKAALAVLDARLLFDPAQQSALPPQPLGR